MSLYETFGAPDSGVLPQCGCGCDDELHILEDPGNLKCFLPALFDLWARDALAADPEPFFERLHGYGFVVWPQQEREAVRAFLDAQWDVALRNGSEWAGGFLNAAILIECAAWLFDPLPLLQRWARSTHTNARLQLQAFLHHNLASGTAVLNTAYERPLFASRIEAWLARKGR
jgi:hypothetical protein